MYSALVVDRAVHRLRRARLVIQPRSVDYVLSAVDSFKDLLKDDGSLKRPLTPDEVSFIESEHALCKVDFRYFAERYGYVERDASDGGGVGPAKFWPSQERALALLAAKEEDNYRELAKFGFSEGIRGVWHKTRQQGATALIRLIVWHRMLFYRDMRSIAGTLDPDRVLELYNRDHRILDNLPFYMRPRIEFDVKGQHISLESLKSRITYQLAGQRAGVGTSHQFDISHMTEVALWDNAYRLEFDFIPAVPKSINTFVGFESTANGMVGPGQYWFDLTEQVRTREHGFENWVYVFTPWYINARKNRAIPPDSWRPAKASLEHSALVERTSPEFTGGETVRLTRDQLYWWEMEFEKSRKLGTLHMFLTNYPATPEQSFQHTAFTALPIETIEWLRANAREPVFYTPNLLVRP